MPQAPCAMAIMAHPDDIEFLCAGTLCRLRDLGWRIVLATMTPGDCGSVEHAPDEIAAIRRAEAAAAAERLGAGYHCLEQRDLLVLLDRPTIRATVELIRRVAPDVLFTHSPADYMVDHEQTSVVVRTAAFGAPIPNFLTEADSPAPALESIPHLYYADPLEGMDILGERIEPHLYVDISAVIERKADLLACHASQRNWLLKHHGVDEYLNSMREWAARRGAECGVGFAEAFRQHRGHAYPHHDRVGETLGRCG